MQQTRKLKSVFKTTTAAIDMTNLRKSASIGVLVALVTFARESSSQAVYAEVRDLLREAAQAGSAQGVMVGAVAEHFTRQFRSEGTLLVRATVLKSYKREGCKRMDVLFTKKDVDTPKGRTDANLSIKLNYCVDGTAPIGLE